MGLQHEMSSIEKIKLINHVFYNQFGFSGNTKNHHDPQNSYLNQVLESKKGKGGGVSVDRGRDGGARGRRRAGGAGHGLDGDRPRRGPGARGVRVRPGRPGRERGRHLAAQRAVAHFSADSPVGLFRREPTDAVAAARLLSAIDSTLTANTNRVGSTPLATASRLKFSLTFS